jgi:hypothetical protein
MNSFNHYSFGAVGQYLYSVVGGISSTTPGYKSIRIQPVPGLGLTWANTSYNSTRGLISTAWTNVGNIFNLALVIPPNTTAQIYVPTTNAAAVTESGLPAVTAPGVSYVGVSNAAAVYNVGSGQYFFSSPLPTPIIVIPPTVVEADAVFSSASFPPLPAGDLLTNASITVALNSTVEGPEDHLTYAALNDGIIGAPLTTNRSFELTGGSITYYLGSGANDAGYTITNLNTYTAWQDDGREDANYSVSYSVDGTNFSPIAAVAYNPSPYPTKDGTGGTLTSLSVSNLTGVKYLQWSFSSSQQNGGVGYTELAAYGGPTRSSTPPAVSGSPIAGQNGFVMNLTGLSIGENYIVQSRTNLVSGIWTMETNFNAGQAAMAFTNSVADDPQKYFRLVGE